MGRRSSANTAELRLRRILGAEQFAQFLANGHIEFPSPGISGRTYLLDARGTLNYRDESQSEPGYSYWLCLGSHRSEGPLHEVANKYLLVLYDEDQVLDIANPQPGKMKPADKERATQLREAARERRARAAHDYAVQAQRVEQHREPAPRRGFSLLPRVFMRRS